MTPPSPHGSTKAAAEARNQAIIDTLNREMEDLEVDLQDFKDEEYLLSPVKIKPAHQAIGLPDTGSVKLPKLTMTLQTPKDVDEWLEDINLILAERHLEHLLDITVPRPPWSHPDALKWQNISRQVRAWLEENITGRIVVHIAAEKPRSELADEYLEDIKKIVEKFRVRWDIEALHELLWCKRADFESPKAFIGKLSTMYRHLWVPVPAHIAIFILLKGLEKDMPTHTQIILTNLTDRQDYHTLTRKDFEKICQFLLTGM